ncbi:MAG TPA: M23 family metallopeptidase [Pyrinomonadaceae bacterium]|jgi:murein DD-endopeptidase MepM/ murein hydrolase activator NlpD|nr:M23 family metallopeptidase [Pyrinomonadaceae bacterium]
MNKDDRLYAFIVAHTSRSRSTIRRIGIHKRWLKVAPVIAILLLCAAAYGFIGMFREGVHLRVERENERLRVENDAQRQKLEQLKDRVDAIEDASRRLAEISGVTGEGAAVAGGAGGPSVPMDEASIAAVEARAVLLEAQLQTYEQALREKARIPSIWPVAGETTDGFGGRHDPFGGSSFEFHPGQDIRAERGTGVVAAATGTVLSAGWQNGYGQMVEVSHGGGLTTRYAHLSKIEVAAGQQLARGDVVGRVGSTGRSTGPHLHYEVRINGEAVNPRAYLPGPADAVTESDAKPRE